MVLSSSRYRGEETFSLATFPMHCHLETSEQIRRFELLRLAFFVLKLRKLEQGHESNEAGGMEGTRSMGSTGGMEEQSREYMLHCSLLRHAIFQQVLTLTALDARSQAMQLIDTCRK